jgi:PKD repeat protein
LLAENECGTDRDTVAVNVTPSTIQLNWFIQASTQFGCAPHQVTITNVSAGGNQFTWDFGDGTPPYTSLANNEVVTHTYANPGNYNITLSGTNGCTDTFGVKPVRVIRSPLPNFSIVNNNACPGAIVRFSNQTDTATAYTWTFGDPTSGIRDTSNLANPTHVYSQPGTYTVTLEAVLQDNVSGINCPARIQFPVNVIAPVADIIAPPAGCVGQTIRFIPVINSVTGLAPMRDTLWFVNGVPFGVNPQFYPDFTHTFSQPGTYTVSLVVSTVDNCYDTISTAITISGLPSVNAGPDQRICRGNSVRLNATSSENNYQWIPDATLSCNNCANPLASPLTNTQYIVTTTNAIGCTNKDSVLISVVQPFTITVSPDDTICVNESVSLSVNGADNYTWNPPATLSCSNCPSPVATPLVTTTYTVTGFDNFNCFNQVQNVTIVVGQYPVVTLPVDQVLSAGTLYNVSSQVSNGPIRTYTWTPARDLSCSDCPNPVAEAKKDICYKLEAENIYGCRASDEFCIRVFCENGQVYIPNAFTPGRAPNDHFWVRGKGIGLVKTFRVFNRWGEVVFEKYNYKPAESQSSFATRPPDDQGWDGYVRGKLANPDVYVYVVEVLCENGTPFFYKGNVTLLR